MSSHQGLADPDVYAAQILLPAPLLDQSREVRRMLNSRWPKALIVAAIALLALVHWYVPRDDKHIHNLLYHLVFLPIVSTGMLFGWRGAGLATLITAAAEAPQVLILWRGEPVYAMDQVGEMLVFGVAGVIVGLFVDRERRQRTKLERTKSELEQVYTELRENLDRLRKAERMFTVAQLSASLAHEIRNPLASISGAAGILKRGHGNPENIRECVEIIDKESQRLSKLLTNFLEFARPRAPRFQRTDLGAVIDSVIALADHSPGAAAIQFKKEIQPDLPEVECDSEQLKQVLLNLVINAIQATGNGEVRLCAHARNGTATVSVQDQGHGIPADQQDQIFEPFFTTKEHGTGLGLAIAAKIVEQHGGLLKAESTPGRGLTMMLELPLERKQAV
jgi:signal transduction histidine kinase